jgi:hypothetical protein
VTRLIPAILAPAFLLAAPASSASQEKLDPLRFFAGRTESVGTVKVMLHKPYATRSIGLGEIEPDGSLNLVQRVKDEGKPIHERHWTVRRSAPGRFTASMSEAVGPVAIDRVGDRYRFRFKIRGDLRVEQMLTPLPGGQSARSVSKVKRMGLTVATITGTIRRA